MPFIRFLALVTLSGFLSCDDETPAKPEERWDLQEFTMNPGWSCCHFMDDTPFEDEHPNSIFNTLLGLEDQGVSKIILSFSDPHAFSIIKDGHAIMRGTMEENHQRLWLVQGNDSLDLKIISKTNDSLTMETEGVTCGPVKVTMRFVAVRN